MLLKNSIKWYVANVPLSECFPKITRNQYFVVVAKLCKCSSTAAKLFYFTDTRLHSLYAAFDSFCTCTFCHTGQMFHHVNIVNICSSKNIYCNIKPNPNVRPKMPHLEFFNYPNGFYCSLGLHLWLKFRIFWLIFIYKINTWLTNTKFAIKTYVFIILNPLCLLMTCNWFACKSDMTNLLLFTLKLIWK